MRKQDGGERGDDDGQKQNAHPLRKLTREGQDACEERAGKAHADAGEHGAVLAADGNDDGDEHTKEHDRKAAFCPRGHEVAEQHAEHRAETPARHGGAHRAKVIVHIEIARLRNGEAEKLIREVVGDEHPPGERRVGREVLAERAAHQKVARVDDQHHQRHGPEARVGGDDGDAAVLAGGGIVQKAEQKALKDAQMRAVGADADAEADGKVTEGDGRAVAQTAQIFGKDNS